MSRITTCRGLVRKRLAVNEFFSSMFNDCPLILMCYHSTYDEKINTLREKWLRIACDDKCSSSEDLLEKDNSVSIPQAN